MAILQSGPATETKARRTTGSPRCGDDLDFLQPNPKFEELIRYSKNPSTRFWLFYHASYLEAFGRTAPFGRLPEHVVERIALVLDESIPEPFKNPGDRRTFTKHADKATRVLGWSKFDRKLRRKTQSWLDHQAERSDDPDYLRQVLEARLRSEHTILPADSTIDRMVAQARSAAQDWIAKSIAGALGKRQIKSIDDLRKIKEGSHRSHLQWIKDPVGYASPNTLKDLLDRIELVRSIGLPTNAFEAIHPDMRRRMTVTVQVYSVDNLYADFHAERRRSYLACYLFERQKALIDLAVETFDSVAQGMYRRSESERDEQVRRHAPATNEKVLMFRTLAGAILDTNIPDEGVRNRVFDQIPRDKLSAAYTEAEDLARPEDFNCFDFLERRYNYLRGFFPRFLRVIEFDGTPAAQPILQAVRALRYWNAEAIRKVPASAPLDFVPAKWQPYVCPSDGCVDRHYYELCVLNQLHQALQSCEVWAVGGRRYGNVEDLLIPQDQWSEIRDECYQELGLPKDPQVWIDEALGKLTAQIGKTTRNLPSNPQVFTDDGRVHLRSLDPEELPERIVRLKEKIAETWPQIRIQDLLVQVDSWVDFTRHFRTPRGRRPSLPDFGKALFASLIAKGCNIGMVKMAALAPGIRQGTFRRIDEIYLYEDTLRRVTEHLVETIHSLPVAKLLGDDTISMSDGMRLRTRVRTLNAAFMPEHFAPGQRAITFYWHVSHQGPAYGAQVFGNDRDAAYVLDQIMHIRSELPIKEHYTDTHGATENAFALADAFGIEFCPRFKSIHTQQLYHPPGMKVPGPFKAHFAGAVDVDLIKEHWDDFVRILASIGRGVTSVVLLSQRLSSYADHNPLYRVIREAGRIHRTRHILRVYDEPVFRRRINAGLDRVENFNNLARHMFFARRGENWERDFEEQLNRASSLAILANACVLWNAVHLSEVYQQLQSEGFEFEPTDFLHVSPYAFEHIIPYGQYFFNLRKKQRKDAFSKAHWL